MTLKSSMILVAGMAVAAPAVAAPLAPGGTLFLPTGEVDPLGGSIIASATLPFATSLYTGTLTSLVISGDTTNTLGGLTFVYILRNDSTSQNALARLTVNGYASWTTDASFNVPLTGLDPLFIDRQSNGDSVGFSFSNALGHSLIVPGASSTWLVVQTNAPAYTTNIANVIDGAVTQVGTFAPIPTPGAAALMGIGALAAGRRRR